MRPKPIAGCVVGTALILAISGCGGSSSSGHKSPDSDSGSSEEDLAHAFDGLSDSSESSSLEGGALSDAQTPTDAPDAQMCVVFASNYDQTCTVDQDCVAVATGDVCGGPICTFAAINIRSQDAYESALEAAWALNPPMAFACQPAPPCCQAGYCTTPCGLGSPYPFDEHRR